MPKVPQPEIIDMPAQKMAVVHGKGRPDEVIPKLMPALFGSVYTLKFQLKKQGKAYKVGPPRARWPDAHLLPMEQWTAIMGIPVPDDTTSLPQKEAETEVKLETWDYGTVAQILHIGPYSDEGPTVERLHKFIADNGYAPAGPHEEEYLTRPDAKVIKTIIRYEVKKAS